MSATMIPARAVTMLARSTQETIDRYTYAAGLDLRRSGAKAKVSKRHAAWARQIERAARLLDVWPDDPNVLPARRLLAAEAALEVIGLVTVPPVVKTGRRVSNRRRKTPRKVRNA